MGFSNKQTTSNIYLTLTISYKKYIKICQKCLKITCFFSKLRSVEYIHDT